MITLFDTEYVQMIRGERWRHMLGVHSIVCETLSEMKHSYSQNRVGDGRETWCQVARIKQQSLQLRQTQKRGTESQAVEHQQVLVSILRFSVQGSGPKL